MLNQEITQNLSAAGNTPLPSKELRKFSDLIGHTIKAVIEAPGGQVDCGLLIVTDTGHYLALTAEYDMDYAPIIENACDAREAINTELSDWASAEKLLLAGCVSGAEYDLAKAKELRYKKRMREFELEWAREEVKRLEAQVKPSAFVKFICK